MSLLLTTCLLPVVSAGAPSLHAVYLGQDGYDYCSPDNRLGPDDVQDLHLRLEGLAPDRRIVEANFTRDGGGQWTYWERPQATPHFRAQILRDPKSVTADVFLEPSNDDQRFDLSIELKFADGPPERTTVHCGRSDPNLFMPQATLAARWVGQDGHDLTGRGPAAGPDGFQDARIDLQGLSRLLEIRSIGLDDGGTGRWECGPNRDRVSNAELVWDARDRSKASLFFSPAGDLRGRTLALTVTYANERSQHVSIPAGTTDASLPMPAPKPIVLNDDVSKPLGVRWLGQDPQSNSAATRGIVHAQLLGLPPAANVVAAAISDPCGGYWIWCPRAAEPSFYATPAIATDLEPLRSPTDHEKFGLLCFAPPGARHEQASLHSLFDALPLSIERAGGSPTADLSFPAFRDESHTHMTLRLLLSDSRGVQSTAVCGFEGGSCDPYLRGQMPADSSAEAHPGDDLAAMAARFGHVHLAAGSYSLTSPLVLKNPVAITGPRDAVLRFSQPSDSPAWRDAIELAAGNITLSGFSIRFSTPVRWDMHSFGASAVLMAVGGRRDASGEIDPLVNLTIEKMDIESAPLERLPNPGDEKPYSDLIRFGQATSGKITGNILRGGTTDVMHGPWEITDNTSLGTMPGTMVWDTFAAHYAHDLVVARNHVAPVEPCGKTWRFFVLTQAGNHIAVTDNSVSNIGMKDSDRLENPNAPEIVLTESYRLNYEGRPAGICAEGRIVQIPLLLYGRIEPGCVVSILGGSHAGQWFHVAQPLSPTAVLLDQALPRDLWDGNFAMSIAKGFCDGRWERNVIDARAGGSALFVLAGNHWNQRVTGNHLQGGNEAMRIAADATECPGPWGWSRTPLFDLVLDHNLCEDARGGIGLNVSGDPHAKSTAGRTYLTADLRNNTIGWSRSFLAACRASTSVRPAAAPLPIHLGSTSGPDELQMRVRLAGNVLSSPPGAPSQPPVIAQHATVEPQARP